MIYSEGYIPKKREFLFVIFSIIAIFSITTVLLQINNSKSVNNGNFGFKNQQELSRSLKSEETIESIMEEVCESSEDQTGQYGMASKTGGFAEKGSDLEDLMKNAAEGKDYLKKYLYQDGTQEDLINSYLMDLAPLLALFIISLIGYFVYVACYLCDCFCQKLICCKKKNDQFYTNLEMRWPIMGLIFFSLWVGIAACFGLYFGAKFTDGYYILKCQFLVFINDFDAGVKDKNWYGLDKLVSSLGDIDDDMVTKIENTFSPEDWMDTQFTQLKDISKGLWVDDENAADQYIYNTSLDGSNDDKLDSFFYNNIWGDSEAEGTHCNNIQQLVDGPMTVVDESMTKAQDTGLRLRNSGFSKVIADGQNSIEDFGDELFKMAKDFKKSTEDSEDTVIPIIKSGVQYYFVICIIISVLSIVTAFMVSIMKCFKLRVCMHVSWCIFSIWMIVGFLLSTVLYAIALTGVQTCDIISGMRENSQYLEDLDLLEEDVVSKIKICNEKWGGDGKILKEFDIDKEMENLRNLNSEMAASFEAQNKDGDEIKKITNYLNVAAQDLLNIRNYGYFQPPDINNVAQEKVYEIKVGGENGLSGVGGTGEDKYVDNDTACGTQQDKFYDGDCPDSFVGLKKDLNYVLQSDEYPDPSSTNDPKDLFNICGNIHEYYSSGSYTELEIIGFSQYSVCMNTENVNESTDKFDRILYFVEQKNKLTARKIKDIDEFTNTNTQYLQNVQTWMDRVGLFSDDVEEVLNNTEDLFDNGVNCHFIGTNLYEILDTICEIAIPDIYSLAINLIILSVGMLLGSLFLFCTGFRFANIINKELHAEKTQKEKAAKYVEKPQKKYEKVLNTETK